MFYVSYITYILPVVRNAIQRLAIIDRKQDTSLYSWPGYTQHNESLLGMPVSIGISKKMVTFADSINPWYFNHVKNLLTRTITGTLFVGLIILALTLGYNYLFLGVFASISVLALAEFYGLTQQQKSITLITDIYGGMALFFGMTYATYYGGSLICFSPYLLYILLRFVIQLYSKEADPLKNWAYSFMGQIYVALPLAIICAIYNLFGAHILLALFIFIWVNDTGAFCVGCTFGKHRLFERISPKKS